MNPMNSEKSSFSCSVATPWISILVVNCCRLQGGKGDDLMRHPDCHVSYAVRIIRLTKPTYLDHRHNDHDALNGLKDAEEAHRR